jgi:predicted O-methyltransferase YrrM
MGANIGYTACLFAAAIKANWKAPVRVYALEPDLASFQTLGEIVRRKNLGDSVDLRLTPEKFPRRSTAFEYAPDGMRELGFEPSALLAFSVLPVINFTF